MMMMERGGALVYQRERGANTWRPDMLLYLQFEDEGMEEGGGRLIRLRMYVDGGRGALRFLVCVSVCRGS